MINKIKDIFSVKMVGSCSEQFCKNRIKEVESYSVEELKDTFEDCNKCFTKYYCNETVRNTRNYIAWLLNTKKIK